MDPTSDEARAGTARRCAKTLGLDLPTVVDGVDDAVALAYSAWPERIYVLRPDGRIHYKSGLGPFGFRPAEAEAALVELLGGATPPSADPADAATRVVEDDGVSGTWAGRGSGSTTRGKDAPFRLFVRVGGDGTAAGHAEAGSGRTRLELSDARFDREAGTLVARCRSREQPLRLEATLNDGTFEGTLSRDDGKVVFAYELTRRLKASPLVPGVDDAVGTWRGKATDRDPAQAGTEVELVLVEAEPDRLSGTVTIGDQEAEIERGLYRAATGVLSAVAVTPDGDEWVVRARVEGRRAEGAATLGAIGLVVPFEIELVAE